MTLFDTIKEIVKLDAIQAQINYAVFHDEASKMATLKQQHESVHHEIARLLLKLTDGEMAQILERYPHVVTL